MPCSIKVRGRINQYWLDCGYLDGVAKAQGEPIIVTPPKHLQAQYKRGFDAGKKAGKRQQPQAAQAA